MKLTHKDILHIIQLFVGVILLCIFVYCWDKRKSRLSPEGYTNMYTIPSVTKRTHGDDSGPIPKIVFQTWNSHEVTKDMYDVFMSNIQMNPDFDFRFYDDAQCAEYLKINFSNDVFTAFNTLKPGAFKADLWRLCVLYKEGGIYMDIKFKTEIPLKDILKGTESMFVQDITERYIYQGFIVARPGDQILKMGIDKIVENVKGRHYADNFLDVTGPAMFGRIIYSHSPEKILYKLSLFDNMKHSIVNILTNTVVTKEYSEYRNDQRNVGTPHYSIMWNNRDIYNDN